jgi:bacterioferritin (cytochrome b1)
MIEKISIYQKSLILVAIVIFSCCFASCQNASETQKTSLNENEEEIEKIREEIILMGQEDQKYRQMFHSYQADSTTSDSSNDKLGLLQYNKPLDRAGLIRLMNDTDAVHSNRLSQIIDKYGWPTKSEFGSQVAEYSFLIIQHANAATQKKYFPHLETAAKQGEASMQNVAMMKDRMLMREGKPQLYGTQIVGMNNIMMVYPIEDEANVDKRRKEMGLGPLDEYLQQNGIKPRKR